MDRPPRKRVRREGTFGKFDNTQWPDGSNETIATLARERDEARAALRKYGYHTAECELSFISGQRCTCGLEEALAPTEGKADEPSRG